MAYFSKFLLVELDKLPEVIISHFVCVSDLMGARSATPWTAILGSSGWMEWMDG